MVLNLASQEYFAAVKGKPAGVRVVEVEFREPGPDGPRFVSFNAKRARGIEAFDKACTDCHARGEGEPGSSGPGLSGLGSRDYYRSFLSNPKSALHMGDKSEMPRFDRDLSLLDRDLLAEYLVWLRTHTQHDLDALGPL